MNIFIALFGLCSLVLLIMLLLFYVQHSRKQTLAKDLYHQVAYKYAEVIAIKYAPKHSANYQKKLDEVYQDLTNAYAEVL